MKCHYCGNYYRWYEDVNNGFCSPECAAAWDKQSRDKAERDWKIITFVLKALMMGFPYILLAIFGLRQIFPGMVDTMFWVVLWGYVIFFVIYGFSYLFFRECAADGIGWAKVIMIVLSWMRKVGILATLVLIILDWLVIKNFGIIAFMLTGN